MPTSVHIPKPLLAAVDRKARALRISRNRLIVRALERDVVESPWSAGFLDRLLEVDEDTRRAVTRLAAAIRVGRRSKSPPKL